MSTNKKLMQFFSSLSDETRLSILLSLAEKPKTVNEIHAYVGKNKLTLSAISHQLKQLSDTGLVTCERKGRTKVLQLSGTFCWCILRDALSHFKTKTKCKECSKLMKQGFSK